MTPMLMKIGSNPIRPAPDLQVGSAEAITAVANIEIASSDPRLWLTFSY